MIERMSNHEIVCSHGRMGRTVVEELQRAGRDVVAVQRANQVLPSPTPDFTVAAGDVLVVFGRRDQIAGFEKECGETVV